MSPALMNNIAPRAPKHLRAEHCASYGIYLKTKDLKNHTSGASSTTGGDLSRTTRHKCHDLGSLLMSNMYN